MAAVVPSVVSAQSDGGLNVEQDRQTAPTVTPGSIPVENIDGSRVNARTQSETLRLVRAYQLAEEEANKEAALAAIKSLEALYGDDSVNLSLVTWLGYIYTVRGNHEVAAVMLEPALGKSSSAEVNLVNLKNVASGYYLSGDYRRAIPRLKGLTEASPEDASAFALLGSAHLLSGDYAGAVAPLEKARELAKDKAQRQSVSVDLALAYSKAGMPEKAIGLFGHMRADGGLSAPQLAWMGYFALENGQADEAIVNLEAAYALDKDDPAVVNNLANAYLKRNGAGDKEKATRMFEELYRLDGQNGTAAYNVGAMYLERGEYATARIWFERALERSADPFAHNNLGRAFEGLNNLPQAARHYAAASDLRTDNRMFAKNAGVIYSRVGNDAATITYLERARTNGETSAEVLVTLANAYSKSGNQVKAQELMALSQVQERLEDNPDYWFNLGVAAHKDGKYDEAEAHYRKTLELRHEDLDATNNLGVLMYEKGDFEQAYLMFEKVSGLDEGSVRAKKNMAACLVKLGRVPEAVEIWRGLVHQSPSDTGIRLDLADALWNTGDTPAARFHYSTVLKAEPNNVRAMNGMGLWHLLQNENREAAALFDRATKTQATYMPAYRNLAIAYERLNRVADAIAVLERALKISPNDEEAKKTLARLKSTA